MNIEFLFYTYDATGRSVVVPIWAEDYDQAVLEFDYIYGAHTPVDFILTAEQDAVRLARQQQNSGPQGLQS